MGMLIRKAAEIRYSEVTPKQVYLNRRRFLATLPAAGALVSGALSAATFNNLVKSRFDTDEKVTPFKDVSTTTTTTSSAPARSEPAQNAKNFQDRRRGR